jgi:hypothetical protein
VFGTISCKARLAALRLSCKSSSASTHYSNGRVAQYCRKARPSANYILVEGEPFDPFVKSAPGSPAITRNELGP